MTSFGYTLSSEEHGPRRWSPTRRGPRRSASTSSSISDHFHPWVTAQGHSPFVWSVLGGIAGVDRAHRGRGRA